MMTAERGFTVLRELLQHCILSDQRGDDVFYCSINVGLFCVKNYTSRIVQGGSNMAGIDLYVKKPHCAAAVRP